VGDLDEEAVTHAVAERVVEGFEVVKINQKDGVNRTAFSRSVESVERPLLEQLTIGQPSEWVMERFMTKAFFAITQ